MKILKIIDGFITNSSSSSATILIALRKGKDLKEIAKKVGMYTQLPESFYDFTEKLGDIKDWDIEVDHLTDEYDLMINYILTYSFGDSNYKMPQRELKALKQLGYKLEKKGIDDVIVLYFSEGFYS